MIEKKICMIGSFAVGKTSLLSQYVSGIFSDKYLTTIGVKIDKKETELADGTVLRLILWDIHGDDEFQRVRPSYLRGASGYLLVADGTRRETIDKAIELQHMVRGAIGDMPFVFIINKHDLVDEWIVDDELNTKIAELGWDVVYTSAKKNQGVDEVFSSLVDRVVS